MRTITLTCEDDSPRFAGNRHRIILKEETPDSFIGWPDPSDNRNSPHHNPETDRPGIYPKFAWKVAIGCLLAAVFYAGPSRAADLPDAPSAVKPAAIASEPDSWPRFWDKKQTITFAATFAIRAADAGVSCRNLGNGGSEHWMPVSTCGQAVALIMAGQGTQTLAQWWLYKHGHKTIARWVPVLTLGNVAGLAYSLEAEPNAHPAPPIRRARR